MRIKDLHPVDRDLVLAYEKEVISRFCDMIKNPVMRVMVLRNLLEDIDEVITRKPETIACALGMAESIFLSQADDDDVTAIDDVCNYYLVVCTRNYHELDEITKWRKSHENKKNA